MDGGVSKLSWGLRFLSSRDDQGWEFRRFTRKSEELSFVRKIQFRGEVLSECQMQDHSWSPSVETWTLLLQDMGVTTVLVSPSSSLSSLASGPSRTQSACSC